MNKDTCPFCADPNLLASFTEGDAEKVMVLIPVYMRQDRFWKKGKFKQAKYTVHAEAELRGDRLRMIFDEENFDARWRDFKVEVLGIQSVEEMFLPKNEDRVYYSPPPPFFFAMDVWQGNNQPFAYQQFFACRITHKDSDVSIFVHWWANHGRIMRVDSSLLPDTTNDTLAIIKAACDFFQREKRGDPKLSLELILDAHRRLGSKTTQRAIAGELKVSERALEKWRARQGMSSWRQVENWFNGSPK
jgi:hypothetical protein